MAGVNNISKDDALLFARQQNPDRKYVADALISTTLYGNDNPSEQRYGFKEVSYFCRMFNITTYGTALNTIKGRYCGGRGVKL